METSKYTIQELCEQTGFSRRTIRFYVQEGLINPPAGRGRGGFYAQEEMDKLLFIAALREEGYALKAITARLQHWNNDSSTHEMLDASQNVEFCRENKPVVQPQMQIRFTIAPGMDLIVDQTLEQHAKAKIQQILALAQDIMEDE